MKKVIFFVSIVLFLFIINNFFHSIYRLWQKQDLIVSARKELTQEQLEQRNLKQTLEKVQNPSYLEEEARNKLFMVKPGEEIVVVPKEAIALAPQPTPLPKPDPVWVQWYKLF